MTLTFRFFLVFLSLFVSIIFSGCSTTETVFQPDDRLYQVDPDELFEGDDLHPYTLINAVNQSLVYLKRMDPAFTYRYGEYEYTADEVIRSMRLLRLHILSSETYADLTEKLSRDFLWLKSPGNEEGMVQFTGYFEPVYEGSLTPRAGYDVPVYRRPDDLAVLELGPFRSNLRNKTIVYRKGEAEIQPYYTRQDIMEKGVLKKKDLEIAWMKDPVDLFFMQIQGSGVLSLPDGREMRLGYSGSNGRPYSSIGKLLIQEGRLTMEEMSMQAIRQYLKDHPEELNRVLYHNQSYIFFSLRGEEPGPLGNIQVPLTPNRSIATDYQLFPKGALGYMVAEGPDCDHVGDCEEEARKITRFVLNQDTGGAIRGYDRADLFWGRGKTASASAGKMNHHGHLYILIARKEVISH